MNNKKVTICACASRPFNNKDKISEIAARLKSEGYHVTLEADLCRKMVSPGFTAEGLFLACYPRTILSLLNERGVIDSQVINIRHNHTDEIFSQLDISYAGKPDQSAKDAFLMEIENFPLENGTDAWYPVIDKERCTECGKCHDFCLFGVYTVENKQVKVSNPHNCKNNCPACARICPSMAIIFPKYEKSPINGGTTQEEIINSLEMDKMYRERLRLRLQERKASVPLIKKAVK